MPYFVFAEFGDELVLTFLRRLRGALSGETASPIHVTLRGPYAAPPTIEELEELATALPGYGVKIHGHGYFATPKGFAVFLRAECTAFRELWDKPDFKVPLARIEPHITMFEAPDREDAAKVRDFLKRENLLIHTFDLYLSVYESRTRQSDMFGLPTARPPGKKISRDTYRIPDGILDRAQSLGGALRAARSDA